MNEESQLNQIQSLKKKEKKKMKKIIGMMDDIAESPKIGVEIPSLIVEEIAHNLETEKKKKKKKKKKESIVPMDEVGEVEGIVDPISNGKTKKQKDLQAKEVIESQCQEELVRNIESKKKRKQSHEEESSLYNDHQPLKKHQKSNSTENQTAQTGHVVIESLMTPDQVKEFRQINSITITGNNTSHYKPYDSFSGYFPDSIAKACSQFAKPTPIQAECYPIILSGREVISIAETGSGKTLAFAVPALCRLSTIVKASNTTKPVPRVLVLSPTRELAMQTADVCSVAGKFCGITSICLYGGVPKDDQRRLLSRGVDIVVGTPGRIIDLLDESSLSFKEISYLVLDEADRMLDMGFERDIRKILQQVPRKRQTLMFSATWPVSIQSLAHEFLSDPVQISIGSLDLSANQKVHQIVEVLDPFKKDNRLDELLHQYHKSRKNKVLVFVLYKKEADRVENTLRRKGWKVQSLHGDKSQHERNQVINRFKNGSEPLLIATDVAARGLDINDVEYVINFTFPLTIEDYVHRIGRTGRAGKQGTSHTLFTIHEKGHAGELVNVLKESNQNVPTELLSFGCHTKKKEHAMYGVHFKQVAEVANKRATRITFDE